MRSQKLSASAIKKYLKCPHQYYLHYHSNKKSCPLKEDYHLHFGSIVHKALEIYRKSRKDGKNFSLKKSLRVASENYDNYTLDEPSFQDALEMIEKWEETREYDQVEYLNGPPKNIELVAVEQEFNMEIDYGEFVAHGYIDAIESIDSNHYRVRDYKTGKTFKNKREVHESIQLKMYALATMQMYEVDNVEVAFDQLRFKPPEFIQYSTDELRSFYEYLKHIHKIIENDNSHHPQVGWYCRWCDYKNHCDTINKTQMLENKDIASANLKELIVLYNQYSERAKTNKKLSKQLGDRINDELEKMNIDEYETSSHKLQQKQRKMKKVNPSQVMDKIPPDKLNDILKVKKTELEKVVDEDEIDYGISYTKPYLYVSQKDSIQGDE